MSTSTMRKGELVLMLVLVLINTVMTFSITNSLGISNTIAIQTVSVIWGDIPWDAIVFMLLFSAEALIYQCYISRNR